MCAPECANRTKYHPQNAACAVSKSIGNKNPALPVPPPFRVIPSEGVFIVPKRAHKGVPVCMRAGGRVCVCVCVRVGPLLGECRRWWHSSNSAASE